MKVTSHPHTQLTAAGNGTKVNIGNIQPAQAEGKVVVAAINTNVVVRWDYSNDGFTTIVQGKEETYTANGTYKQLLFVGYKECRPVFVSESGGTAVTVDCTTDLYY